MRSKDTIQWTINIQTPCTFSYKIKPRNRAKFLIHNPKETHNLKVVNHDFIVYKGSFHRSTRINYKIRDIQNNQIIDQYKGKLIDFNN